MSLDIKWGEIDTKSSVDLLSIKGIIPDPKSKLEEIPNQIRGKKNRIFQQIKNPIFNFILTEGYLGSEKDIKKRIEKEFKNKSHQPSYYEYVKELANKLNLKIITIVVEKLKTGEFEIELNVECGLVKELNKKKSSTRNIVR